MKTFTGTTLALLILLLQWNSGLASYRALTYEVKGLQSKKCLEANGGNINDNGVIDIWQCLDPLPSNERWLANLRGTVTRSGVNYNVYQFVNLKSNKCLTVHGGSTGDNSVVDQFSCQPTNSDVNANQHWYIVPIPVPNLDSSILYAFVVGLESNSCLTVHGEATSNGAVVDIFKCVGQTNQVWVFKTLLDTKSIN